MTLVKVCGITNITDAKKAAALGADFVGFIFYKKSPRYVEPKNAKAIIEKLPGKTKAVGVFVNETKEKVIETANYCNLDMIQLHGNETPSFCAGFNGPVIKAFRIKDGRSIKSLKKYGKIRNVFAYLLDSHKKGAYGGTGKRFNWKILKTIKNRKIFLSGGLSLDNIEDAISIVKPYAVDVASGVELRPGKKDHKKLKDFIRKAKKKK